MGMSEGAGRGQQLEEFPATHGRAVGYLGIAAGALVVADVLIEWRTWHGLSAVAGTAAVVILIWLGLLRPKVVAYTDRVVLRNFLRDVHVPWPLVESVSGSKALTIEADGHEYRSAAVTVGGMNRRDIRRWAGAGRMNTTSGQFISAGPADPLPGETAAGARERMRSGGDRPVPPLAYAQDRVDEFRRRYGKGTAEAPEPASGGHQVRVRWRIGELVLLALAVGVAVLAGVLGSA